MSLTRAVKAEAHRLGFLQVGICRPDPPPHIAAFERWLAAGFHGEMQYLAADRSRQRRADPRLILPECKSILVLATHYSPPSPRAASPGQAGRPAGEEGGPARGRIAAYALGDDYHEVLPGRLRALAAFIETQADHPVPNRWYTDTGPVLERDLAQRAGLGWIGKNTCLIHPKMGSYFLLAEILLGIELEPDPPFLGDYCGTCTRCIEACPTQCIMDLVPGAPETALARTLDARRCVSYLTIEQKGPIPTELRSLMDNWIFGCDICQQVCPWNQRFAIPAGDPAFAPRPGVSDPNLSKELALTPESFNTQFRRSPVKRAKRRGYLRNVAVALGNALSPAAVSALAWALQHNPEPLVRGQAAWALGRTGGKNARLSLEAALLTENEATVLAEIHAALAQLP